MWIEMIWAQAEIPDGDSRRIARCSFTGDYLFDYGEMCIIHDLTDAKAPMEVAGTFDDLLALLNQRTPQ